MALASAAAWGTPAAGQDALALQPSTQLAPAPGSDAARMRPLILRADALRVRPEIDAVAEGKVEFRRAGTVIRAQRLSYDSAEDLAVARGDVLIARDGVSYRGPELQLKVQRFEGFFLQPEFEFESLGAGGRAARVDFIDSARLRAERAVYTSCPRDEPLSPDWLLSADRVSLDVEANEGIAEGAVLRFLDVPILALPVLSFPLSDDRKSGWLPPTVGLDSRSGFELGVPYYWNIAPNRDATLAPIVMTRRGLGLASEFRYLEAQHGGRLQLHLLPHDASTGTTRDAWTVDASGKLPAELRYAVQAQRVSDDDYWKDFPGLVPATSPRLLSQDLNVEREMATALGRLTGYARLQHWQVLQTGNADELIVSPYQRSPQLGLSLAPQLPWGLRGALVTEANRFSRPDGTVPDGLPTGWRLHALGNLHRPFVWPGAWLTPKLALNAASYQIEQAGSPMRRASRAIPTASVDAGLQLERETAWFGRAQRQTLEPRLLYVDTPYRDQSRFPIYDSAERDFNFVSIFAENPFTGIDRVPDARQLTMGFTSRLVDAATGAETLRLGLAQRTRFRDQQVVIAGEPLTQRFSDLLFEGSTSVLRPWKLDASLQYNPDSQRIERSILGASFQPGPFRTLSAGYRLARGLSEQVELGWQWPVYRGSARPVGASGGCGGTLYAVGRLNYSLRDSRMTDSLIGGEYDTGCWIARVVAERLSTGRTEATTRLLLQLELSGLSRLGANPLQVLKDNIPGYRLLREPRGSPIPNPEP
ncbi:MAG: LPS-assembly protein LptD [Burkholderiaceae bacterium]|nr:LPS-assembly protein LptD [Burkholderiaceae bacterium]